MGRTQAERKAGTRARLLAAAGELFGAQGYHAVSADAVAERAERTSGALYAHFGSKDGLLHALVREMEGDAVATISFAVEGAGDPSERLAALWRSFTLLDDTDAPWMLLEHELWLWAAREANSVEPSASSNASQGEARSSLARRYASGRAGIARALKTWTHTAASSTPETAEERRSAERARDLNRTRRAEHARDPNGTRRADETATLVLALLLGLHMQRRIDADAVSDETALAGLELLLGIDNRTSVLSHNQGA